MKRVLFTKEQLEECMVKSLQEDGAPVNIDATPDVTAANGNASLGMKNAKNRLSQQGLSGKDVTMTVDSDAITECFTKKQIKEAKLKYLKENSYPIRKKDLK